MKKRLLNLLLGALAIMCGSHSSNAQVLLKDLEPGNNVGSGPHQFTNVDGTVYFFTDPSTTRRHALWKTDGTANGTVMVKDSLISTPVAERLMMRGSTHDTLYFTVNTNVQADTTTELWMLKNGSSPVLVTLLTSRMVNQYSNGEPRKYAMAGGKLFFQMYTDHGYELWVSNGTEAGTHEVMDLFPGSNSGIQNGGTSDEKMAEFNGKVYFQGLTAYNGVKGLYSSDGNTIELVKEGPDFDPSSFTVFNNALYFYAKSGANDGLWKTNGTTAGTVNVSATGFNGGAVIFKNQLYYNVGNTMYKSDGNGAVMFNDSIGSIYGMNSKWFFTRTYKSISTPPYIEFTYWRSDGTAAGTERIVDSLGNSASFVVLNDKMYGIGLDNVLWESDGTAESVKNLFSGTISSPFVVNTKIMFVNFGTGTGYEPWVYTPSGGSSGIFESQQFKTSLNVYPNPSTGHFQLNIDKVFLNGVMEIYNSKGERVHCAAITASQNEIDLSGLAKGIYFVRLNDGRTIYSTKVTLQ
jgi:ELWxxDGT repeat protein